MDDIKEFILENGNKLERLSFGSRKYSVNGISTVIDENCMGKDADDNLKYLIIRENAKIYTQWDDSGSLIF